LLVITGLIDIHNHSIPTLDDGARDMETALAMLKHSEAEGVTDIILTPHYHGGYMENSYEDTHKAFIALQSAAQNAGIKIQLYLGNEIFYYPSLAEWVDNRQVNSMADSDYVLAEFGNKVTARELDAAVSNIVSAGLVPIIAHAERYDVIVSDKHLLEDLISKGALIQMNSSAITGDAGGKIKRLAKWALKNECIHFVASDGHSTGSRRPDMREAAEYIARHYSEDYAYRLMVDNPRCVIENYDLYDEYSEDEYYGESENVYGPDENHNPYEANNAYDTYDPDEDNESQAVDEIEL